MRTFKTKIFARWARKEGLGDEALLDVVDEMLEGQLGNPLGGKVYKSVLRYLVAANEEVYEH